METPPFLRVLEGEARVYRRVWRGSVISTFLNPVLFLAAMGLGLGRLVDERSGGSGLDGLTYLAFLAPGLLAATAMQTGAGDSSWPVMAGIKWRRTYEAILATPVGVGALTVGHIAWVGVRLVFVSVAFVLVMAAFGAVGLWSGLAAVPAAVLTGLAFAAPMVAYTAGLKGEQGLSSMFRFGIVPLFLFSGTFFPISQLPDWLEPVAWVTPLWHGVELCRAIALGLTPTPPVWLSVAYLTAWTVGGTWLAVVRMRRRLVR